MNDGYVVIDHIGPVKIATVSGEPPPVKKTKIWPWVMAAAVAGTVVFAVSKEK